MTGQWPFAARARRRLSEDVLRQPSWVIVAVVALMLVLTASTAAANTPTSPPEARLLVLQSVSLIANGAPADQVVDRLREAEAAPDKQGVDLAAVARALDIIATAGGAPEALGRARSLLEGAISIRVATGYGPVPEPGKVGQSAVPYAVGAEPGTQVVLDEFRPARGVKGVQGVVLLALATSSLALGMYLAHRWRPPTSIRELRRATTTGG